MKTTLLVDGSYLLKSVYDSKDPDVKSKRQTTYKFLTVIRKLLKDFPSINKCIVLFDGENSGKARYEIYNGYKANRPNKSWYSKTKLSEKEIKNINIQKADAKFHVVNIKNYLEELYIRHCQLDEVESDDLIAQYVIDNHKNENINIYTNDRDLCQLVEYDNVNLILANKHIILNTGDKFEEKRHILINKNNYRKHFGIHYKNIVVLKSILGDNSDNIKGVRMLSENKLLNYIPELKVKEIDIGYIKEKLNNINKQTQDIINFNNFISNEVYNLFSDLKIELKQSKRNNKIYLNLNHNFTNNIFLFFENDEFIINNKFLTKFCSSDSESSITVMDYFKKIKYNVNDELILKVIDYIKNKLNVLIGQELYDINYKITSLKEPFLSEKDKDDFDLAANAPMEYYELVKGEKKDIRGGKYLLKLMQNDNFLDNYNNNNNDNLKIDKNNKNLLLNKFLNYIQPFIIIPNNEKKYYNYHLNKNK